jgi:hypothetical protein
MLKLIAYSFLILASIQPTYAQDFSFIPNMNSVDYNLPKYATEEINRNDREISSQDFDRNVNATSEFTPSKARTRANLKSFVTKTRATDPAGAEQMEALFASSDVIGQIGGVMRSFGLSPSNAADAYALYWVVAWSASRGETDPPGAETFKAVAAQAARGLSSSPEFARATDAQKQEMAEALMVQAALIDGHMEAAAGDAAQLKAVAQAVSKGAAASGLNLSAMTLTEQGFVPAKPRKRADASDAVEEPTALASTDQPAGTPEAPNYALIAGAAGAGLGAAFLIGKGMGKRG